MVSLWVLAGFAALTVLGLAAWGLSRAGPSGTREATPPSGRPLQARDGTWVASQGERRIANWLAAQGIAYRYEPEMAGGLTPDFHLEGTDVVIEYWGLAGEPSYEERMLEKLEQYEAHGIEVVSLFPAHLHEIEDVVERELDERGIEPPDRRVGRDPAAG